MQQQPVLVDAKFEQYFTDNNITFTKIRERKDISVADAKVFDLLAVPFQAINKALESKLSPATEANIGAQAYLQLYRINK
jgi:hypothetical protein